MLLDKNFGIEGSLLHNSDFVIGAMKSIFSNASIYLEILNSMSDVFSKEMLSRLILYRLYWDINLMLGLKSHKRPYFDANIFKIAPEEIFVDIGGYNGDTLSDFYSYSGGKFKSYYFFEPGKELLEVARQKYADYKRIVWFQKAVSNISQSKLYSASTPDVPGILEISENQNNEGIEIETVALDDISDIAPTFIKMDVEGAECNVLDGAEKTIRRFMPKMDVCIYHRPNDLVEIYQRLKNYGYTKFFLRAEEASLDYDIVLYAQ